jgi:hypothetical protein
MTSAVLTYLAANWTNDSNILTRHQTHQLKDGVAFHDHVLVACRKHRGSKKARSFALHGYVSGV